MYLPILLSCLFFISCNKSDYKKYRCTENCIQISVQGQLYDSSNVTSNYRDNVHYRILFLSNNSNWLNLYEKKELLIKEGYTTSNGNLNTTISCNKTELESTHSIYVVFYENENIYFPRYSDIYSKSGVPYSNILKFTIGVFCKQKIKINTQQLAIDTFERKDLQIYYQNFSNSVELNKNEMTGSYYLSGIVNKTNYMTLNKYNVNSTIPDAHKNFSLFVSPNTTSFDITY